jgi:hypothetical protein
LQFKLLALGIGIGVAVCTVLMIVVGLVLAFRMRSGADVVRAAPPTEKPAAAAVVSSPVSQVAEAPQAPPPPSEAQAPEPKFEIIVEEGPTVTAPVPRSAGTKPATDSQWKNDLAARKSAEDHLLNLVRQADVYLTNLSNSQRNRSPALQNNSMNQLRNLRNLISAAEERLKTAQWTPIEGRSKGDLAAERETLVTEHNQLANPPESGLVKQVKIQFARSRRARVEQLDAVLGVK